jgi:hypothetical protein
MSANISLSTKLTNPIRLGLFGFAIILAVFLASIFLPETLGADWRMTFRPAAWQLLSGQDPYAVDQFLIAPWSFVLFVPLGLLPENLGMAVLLIVGLVAYAYIAIRLGARPLGLVAILLSPQVMHNLINGNIDWLALLGFVLPPQIGLFFLALKPQIGFALIVYWAYRSLREKQFLRVFSPFIIVTLGSFLLFGLWPLKFGTVQPEYNASAWPISLPFGMVLLVMALHKQKIRIAQAISPLFSPHVMFHSWATMLFALAPDTLELVTAVLVSWLFFAWSVMS